MTTIERLGLLGIRSYGPDKETFIRFNKPLTIILGRNGSGKSTIIEAVKMATTGETPPNGERGAAFIHDPRIDNETETKAKIRLMFSNARGDQYVVSRQFQLTLKRVPRGVGYKPEFKTLAQHIKRMDGGNRGCTATYRCNDLNALLPEFMHVSKPILNNVIFVHQEESLWPLGDPKDLKKKFDEIFAATRYTKALDTIRKFRKDQAAELKTVGVELMHFEEKVQALEKVRAEVDAICAHHDCLQKGVESLNEAIAKLTRQRDDAYKIAEQHAKKQSDLTELVIKQGLLEKEKADRFKALNPYLPELDEDAMRTEQEELQSLLHRAHGEHVRRSKIIEDMNADLDMKGSEYLRRQNCRGMLEQQAKMQEENLTRLEGMKKEISDMHYCGQPLGDEPQQPRLPGISSPLEEWTAALERLLREAETNIQNVSEAGDDATDKANTALNNVKILMESVKSENDRQTKSVKEKRSRLISIREELGSMAISETSIRDAEAKLRTAEALYKEKDRNNRIEELTCQISSRRKEISSRREDLSVLRRLRDQLDEDQSEQARFDFCKETLERKQKQLHSMYENFVDDLLSSVDELGTTDSQQAEQQAINGELSELRSISEEKLGEHRQQLMKLSDRILAKKDVLLQDAERNAIECQTTLNSAKMRKSDIQKQLEELKHAFRKAGADLRNKSRRISGTASSLAPVNEVVAMFEKISIDAEESPCGVGREQVTAVDHALQAVSTEIVKTNQKIAHLGTGASLAEADLEKFERDPKHKCPACGVSSVRKFEEQLRCLQARVERLKNPNSIEEARSDLRQLESTSDILKAMKSESSSTFESRTALLDTISKLDEARTSEHQKNATFAEADSMLKNLQERVGIGSSIEQISSKKLELRQAFLEHERAEKELMTMRNNLSSTRNESRSLSEVKEEVLRVEDGIATLHDTVNRELELLENERKDVRRAETRFHNSRQKHAEQKAMSEKHKRLTLEKKECTSFVRDTESALQSNHNKLQSLRADLKYCETDFEQVRHNSFMAQKHANRELSKRQMDSQSWNNLVREVVAYKQSGKEKELENLILSLKTIEADINTKKQDLRGHEKEQQTASSSEQEMVSRIRNLGDNREYRVQEEELRTISRRMGHLKDEITVLERQAGGSPAGKVERLNSEINSIERTRHATMGEQKAYTKRYKEKKMELAEAEKQGSRRKFDECRIRKQTMELASSDLERYHRALDQALMAFHTLKMNSINRTIKELWQQTYKGMDIDEIEITSDHTDARGGAGGSLKRNFNYRVQMRQKQASLDMRGRCSAGQKVLACLVIRLALAESFCTDCGILALDEPTTNLDRDNVESLADALKSIIETRQRQKNFQLVLITHDEKFIDMIGARNFCGEFFHIFKDDRGFSQAKARSLQDI